MAKTGRAVAGAEHPAGQALGARAPGERTRTHELAAPRPGAGDSVLTSGSPASPHTAHGSSRAQPTSLGSRSPGPATPAPHGPATQRGHLGAPREGRAPIPRPSDRGYVCSRVVTDAVSQDGVPREQGALTRSHGALREHGVTRTEQHLSGAPTGQGTPRVASHTRSRSFSWSGPSRTASEGTSLPPA